MKKVLYYHGSFRLQILSVLLLSLCSLIFSQSVSAATFNLTAVWNLSTDRDMKEYRLYRTDETRTLIGTTPHPGTSYGPFQVTVPDGSSGTLMFVLTAVDTSNLESADSNPASYRYNPYIVATNPSGLQVIVDETAYPGPNTFTWGVGSSHKLSVTSPQNGGPGVEYGFGSWSDGGSKTHTVTAPSSNKTYTANFISKYSLTTSVNLSEGGTVSPSGTFWYKDGTDVPITATPHSGYQFSGWTGVPDSKRSITLDINGPKNVVANFEVSVPTAPKGVSTGNAGTSYAFSTNNFSSPPKSLEYQYDWGDGSPLTWGRAKQSHIWITEGHYPVRVMARCITNTNFVSTWSDVASVTINPKPFIHITSPTKGETWVVNTPHTITWDSGYLTSGTLYLYYWYGGKWHPIDAFPTPGTTQNSYPWTIPDIHDPLTSPKPKGDIQSIKVWIGNWANGRWECWDTNDPDFRILDDGWVFTISNPKGEKGGATLWFDDNAFDGYGVSFGFETFRVNQGAYDVDNQGIMSGTFTLTGLQSAESVSGNLTGSVNPNATKMTLVLKDSNGSAVFNMAGIRLLSEPDILGDWSTTISGDATGGFDPLTIDSFQDGGEVFSHIFGVSGSGTTGSGSVNIQGTFFFTPATKTDSYGNVIGNIVYGVYEMTVGVNEAGVISGTINPNKGKFTFNLTSDNGNKYKLVGHILPP